MDEFRAIYPLFNAKRFYSGKKNAQKADRRPFFFIPDKIERLSFGQLFAVNRQWQALKEFPYIPGRKFQKHISVIVADYGVRDKVI